VDESTDAAEAGGHSPGYELDDPVDAAQPDAVDEVGETNGSDDAMSEKEGQR
jgi:hypothetical protein